MLKIRKYEEKDKNEVIKLFEELKDFLISIDPQKRLRRTPEYGEIYFTNLLTKIEKQGGIIFVAEDNENLVGLISGVWWEWTAEDEAGNIPSKPATILDLIVTEKYRGQNIGKLLIKETEDYFKQQDCDTLYLNVFAPNKTAYDFYQKLGYHDDLICLEKILS